MVRSTSTVDEDSPAAPGRFLRHYAPSTPLVLVDGGPAALLGLAARLVEREVRVAVLSPGGATTFPDGIGVVALGPNNDPALVARDLYAALRRADALGAEVLLVQTLGGSGLAEAVDDRLFRAAQGRRAGDDAGAAAGIAALVEARRGQEG